MACTHEPRASIIVWCLFVAPFTIWDTAYLVLRPHSFPGRKYHAPFFQPMVQWAEVDHLYGQQAWDNNEGFTAAQSVVNVFEAVLCLIYVVMVWSAGGVRFPLVRNKIHGSKAAQAMLVGLIAGVAMSTKTTLYFMREIFSRFEYTRHNERHPFLTLWGFMNFLYIFASGVMIGAFATELLDNLSASNHDKEE